MRGLAPTTIVRHVSYYRGTPELIAYLRPAAERLTAVAAAIAQLQRTSGPDATPAEISQRALYEALGGQVPYTDIRLCMLFLPTPEAQET